jgi:hypothetical protein
LDERDLLGDEKTELERYEQALSGLSSPSELFHGVLNSSVGVLADTLATVYQNMGAISLWLAEKLQAKAASSQASID